MFGATMVRDSTEGVILRRSQKTLEEKNDDIELGVLKPKSTMNSFTGAAKHEMKRLLSEQRSMATTAPSTVIELQSKPTSTSSTLWPLIALGVSQTIFCGWHVLGARVLEPVPYVNVLSFTVVRQILSYFVLWVAARIKDGRVPLPQNEDHRYKLLLGGICGGSLMPLFYLSGLVYTTPTIGAAWDGPMLPVLVFIITLSLGIEKISKINPLTQITSLVATLLGSLIVLLGDYHHHKSSHDQLDTWHDGKSYEFIYGNMLLAAMVTCYAVMCIVQRSLAVSKSSCSSRTNHDKGGSPISSHSYPPLTLTSWIAGIGAIGNIILVLWLGVLAPGWISLSSVYEQTIQALQESTIFCFGLLYAVLFMTVFTNAAISYASRYLESSVVTLFCAAQPPITAVMELIMFGKPITYLNTAGMVVTACGIWYFTSSKKRDKQEHSNATYLLSSQRKNKNDKSIVNVIAGLQVI